MTVATPGPPPAVAPRRRWGTLAAVGAVAAVVVYLGWSGLSNALVYYLTPTELLARGEDAIGQAVRLGGLVETGSLVHEADGGLRFVLTDGAQEMTVHTATVPVASFREGAGAVVEGRLGADGVFEATTVIVKHDENYVAPTPASTQGL